MGEDRRARMLGLQADAEERAEERLLARSEQSRQSMTQEAETQAMLAAGRSPRDWMLGPPRYVFEVQQEVAEAQLGTWSDPLRFQFREGADGRLELWMQTVRSEA